MSDRLQQLAELLTSHDVPNSAEPDALIQLAVSSVPASRRASLTVLGMEERLHTFAASDDVAAQLDAIQLELGEGPALLPVERAELVHVPDLEVDLQWPRFARRAISLGACSLLALRMDVESVGRTALAFYAERPHAFDDVDMDVARIVGWVVSTALQLDRQRQRAAHLEIALESNRHIGSAIGILMARELLTGDQAFERLRDTSQRLHRKLRDIADEVIRTGQLPRLD
jgi:hypothetical protein